MFLLTPMECKPWRFYSPAFIGSFPSSITCHQGGGELIDGTGIVLGSANCKREILQQCIRKIIPTLRTDHYWITVKMLLLTPMEWKPWRNYSPAFIGSFPCSITCHVSPFQLVSPQKSW
ncbi:hypothetical protein SADUNF_Sadunf07G0086400 [Salix dunnii]|uniref:Uncharacterized protein n=1 Tax=Salix dunnii TaxID=1413687 RepID=A0A835K066_9ROSI|nr:hypothetical protein SADUNF_Sadunf07G0086400 [Salix dunnii]